MNDIFIVLGELNMYYILQLISVGYTYPCGDVPICPRVCPYVHKCIRMYTHVPKCICVHVYTYMYLISASKTSILYQIFPKRTLTTNRYTPKILTNRAKGKYYLNSLSGSPGTWKDVKLNLEGIYRKKGRRY